MDNDKCKYCGDEGYVQFGEGPLGGFVQCGCQDSEQEKSPHSEGFTKLDLSITHVPL